MKHVRVCLLLAACTLLLGATHPAPRPERTPHLAGDVLPDAYDLTLEPEVATATEHRAGTVAGSETIDVRVLAPAGEIVLNAARIAVLSAQIDDQPARVAIYPVAQQIALANGRTLGVGKHRIALRFVGNILSDAAGLWPDNFNGDAPNLVSTFEAARARTLFPCFDEPAYRASFRIRVVAPTAWTVVSNMPLETKTPIPTSTKSTFAFAPTPPMPTYLLTLDMGVFSAVRGSAGATPVTVYVRPGQEPIGRSILATAQAVIPYYEDLLGSPFPMPKLDYVVGSGVLNDTHEGWGAITTFTEYDASGAQMGGGIPGRQIAFSYVAFPIAQQWFGGSVGIASFGDAWATNGLASWAEARAETALHPEFPPQDIDWAWNAISLWGSRAPIHGTGTDDRDGAAFDALFAGATDTGLAVLRQYDAYVGDAAMRAAAKAYLVGNAGRAARDDAFWTNFGTAAARAYGTAWLDQPGAPVVDIATHCAAGVQITTLTPRPIRSNGLPSRARAAWPIPISLTSGGRTQWALLGASARRVSTGGCGSTPVANLGLRPPYLVHYDSADLAALGRDARLTWVDRLRLLRDTSTLYRGGGATLPELLAALDGYRAVGADDLPFGLDTDLIAAATALRDSPWEARFAASVGRTYVPLLRGVGFLPKQRPSLDLARSYLLLALAPDRDLANDAIAAWRTSRTTPGLFGMSYWAFEPFAASAANASDVDWALAHLDDRHQVYPGRFLWGVRDPVEVARVLSTLSSSRRFYASTLWAMGTYSPAFISAYLDGHVADVLRGVPPSQRAWSLAFGIANGPWAGRTPTQWRAFLERHLEPRDAPTIHAAMLVVEKNWALRRRLERELSN
jgi:aminopeptidase N